MLLTREIIEKAASDDTNIYRILRVWSPNFQEHYILVNEEQYLNTDSGAVDIYYIDVENFPALYPLRSKGSIINSLTVSSVDVRHVRGARFVAMLLDYDGKWVLLELNYQEVQYLYDFMFMRYWKKVQYCLIDNMIVDDLLSVLTFYSRHDTEGMENEMCYAQLAVTEEFSYNIGLVIDSVNRTRKNGSKVFRLLSYIDE